ncbi:LuxR family transcriptional regulator [Rhizobium sp. SSA_523]|nr:LuxR family transcriptional regulator [Rhizobium sp. SSA_523]MCO5731127.1 LuxR family transcriptional regulator [Rhizobium sp. SSA_523]WKC24077.1 LuxR C-terminal-related transcriptional regulator [Rhizobium sp. SSA_523]
MRSVCQVYGYRYFLIYELPARTVLDLGGNTIITNLPSDLITEFDSHKLLQASPLVHGLRETTTPLDFTVGIGGCSWSNPQAGELLNRHAIAGGTLFPVHDREGQRAVVGLLGDRPPLLQNQLLELLFLAVHVYDKLAAIGAIDVRPPDTVSERELDCLNWTAVGKTSAEIADILDLSEHTVNHYLNRATRKLDAVNRTQAVAKAIKLGLIK